MKNDGGAVTDLKNERQGRTSIKASYTIYVGAVLFLVLAVAVVLLSVSLSSCHKSAMRVDSRSTVSHSLKILKQPLVILLSADGFRWGYQWKVATPNIDRLKRDGTEAYPGMLPVYPSITFPNHYSIATGLYPAWHGIILNSFRDPTDASRKTFFMKNDTNPKWWLGEPMWETVVNHGLKAATYFWPGSEVAKGKWTCPPAYCHRYNESVPFATRIDTVLSWVDLPEAQRPSLIAVYIEDPDAEAHTVGPDSPEISDAVTRVDAVLGRLLDGLERRKILQDVNVIMVSDHGFVGTCDTKIISLDELSAAANTKLPAEWIESVTPVLAIRPPARLAAKKLKRIVAALNAALASGKVANGKFLKVFVREELPARLHYSGSDRISPIIGMVAEGYKVVVKRPSGPDCGGAHGYDNTLASMRAVFFAAGPRFARGKQVEAFVNVEIYNVVTQILGIKGVANNGTRSLTKKIIR
ncbi:hypothetical protein SELMODRAFT_442885 [Selaginella moellendorffii]|uniref:Uncharacterized protein n=1 Tax=Selaginella moellendorffii TaxID=88036 RepID=D8RWV5_SELML|nr:hypothetical protein SELMODRAFT_442885 [Selaginella moellendorffii]